MSELEKFWSPEPILAVKRYIRVYERPGFLMSEIKPGPAFKLGEWVKAECRNGVLGCNGSPALYHYLPHAKVNPAIPLCGFYGWKRLKRPENNEWWYTVTETPNVLVEFKGRVIEHERGYRAEYQRIIRELTDYEIRSGIIEELRGYKGE